MKLSGYEIHFAAAAKQMAVRVHRQSRSRHDGFALGWSNSVTRRVWVPRVISDEETYLAAMHELGHCADPYIRTLAGYDNRDEIKSEIFAWDWVMRNTIFPITFDGFDYMFAMFGTYMVSHNIASHPFRDRVLQGWADRSPVIPYPERRARIGLLC